MSFYTELAREGSVSLKCYYVLCFFNLLLLLYFLINIVCCVCFTDSLT